MPDFLYYWGAEAAERELARGDVPFDYGGSEQFKRLSPGDTVWLVTSWTGKDLTLVGRLRVAEVLGQAAARKLGRPLWHASYHAFAPAGAAEYLREVDITDLAAGLRFLSPNDRLTIKDGRIDRNQLQTMRTLTGEAAALLRGRWDEEDLIADISAAISERAVGTVGFPDPETVRRVEKAAVARVTEQLESEGWVVTSVEAAKIGYDLCCTNESSEMHVEVKGTQSAVPSFIITGREFRASAEDAAFMLYVVTKALTETPSTHIISGPDIRHRFRIVPLAYRCVPRASEGEGTSSRRAV